MLSSVHDLTLLSALLQLAEAPGYPKGLEPHSPGLVTGPGTPKRAPALPHLRLCFPTPRGWQHEISTVKLPEFHLPKWPCPVVEQTRAPQHYTSAHTQAQM